MQSSNFEKIVSVIIPCRNEEKFIAKCLDSVLAQTYPKNKMEVLVIDGESGDKTAEIVGSYSEKYPFIRVIKNPKKITPAAMNMGIKEAHGEVVVRLDAHSIYPSDYIEKGVGYLKKLQADNVGGIRRAVPAKKTMAAKAIALTFSSFFGVGNARYQTGTEKPREVDTVFCGFYRKEIFKKIGFYNENLVRSQDMEFNIRLKRNGGKIILVPDITIQYFPKSDFGAFFRHNIKDGIWAIVPLKFGVRLKLRHFIPLFFVLGLFGSFVLSFWYYPFIFATLGIAVLYLSAALYFSAKLLTEENNGSLLLFLVTAFAVRHFGYGIGSLIGLVKLIL